MQQRWVERLGRAGELSKRDAPRRLQPGAPAEPRPNFLDVEKLSRGLRASHPSPSHCAAASQTTRDAGAARANQSSTMNPSLPVASAINGVEFQFFSAQDIRTVSVKRISNPTTFDSLLHPVPGGLHDAALGSFLDNL
jgi:hypothetical protein